jgi:heat shock protein HslJ
MAGRPVLQSTVITLQFNPEAGTLRGQSSCNTYSADYTLSHSSTPSSSPSATLRLSNLTHTDIQCTEAQMNTEERFLALLAKTNQLSLSPDGWTLTLSAKGRNPLVFSLQ